MLFGRVGLRHKLLVYEVLSKSECRKKMGNSRETPYHLKPFYIKIIRNAMGFKYKKG